MMRQLGIPVRDRLGGIACSLLMVMGCTTVPLHPSGVTEKSAPHTKPTWPETEAKHHSAANVSSANAQLARAAKKAPVGSPRDVIDQGVGQITTASTESQPQLVTESKTSDSAGIQQVASAMDDVPVEPIVLESESTAAASPAGYALSLGNVLSLAENQNPNVALARERINEAYARADRADTLWLPSIRAGLNYNHHEGQIQDVAGNVFNTNRSAFYGGLGANGVGAASPSVPGVVAQFHLTDAIFQPKIAEHQAAARQFGASAVRNDILRDTAVAYLELLRAEQSFVISIEAVSNTRKLASVTHQFATTGQGLQSDDERLQVELALRQEQLAKRREAVMVASARLAQILHADPATPIQSGEPHVIPLEILQLEGTAASYVATGLQRRPELAEQKHLVCEAVERLQREKYAPLVPSVLLGLSYGGFGGGIGSSIVNSGDRWDADAVAYWEVRNLGFGEKAARAETASLARQAQHREVALLDRIAREVTEAHAQVIQRQERLELARQSIAAAEKSYALNLQRIENAQGLPIEVLQSITALATAREAYLNAVVDYNIAQFELCRSIGWFAN